MTNEQALAYFLDAPTDDRRADVVTALREAARRRKEGPQATTALIRLAHEELRMNFREIERVSQEEPGGPRIDHATAQRLYATR